MRCLGAVTASVVSALAAAGAAGATSAPPLHGLQSSVRFVPAMVTLRSAGHGGTVSCSAHARRARGTVARFERKLAPVACEQPPRSKVLDGGFFLGR
jgi:hypothetical protein